VLFRWSSLARTDSKLYQYKEAAKRLINAANRISGVLVRNLSGNPVRVQTVDATPSGITLFSKVVFMKAGKRFGLSAAQKLEVWSRWKTGQTLHEIGRAFGKPHTSIRCLVSLHGGIAPAVRRRSLPVRRSVRSPNV
jgi:hypothetical protein